jgi:hypothetical protein
MTAEMFVLLLVAFFGLGVMLWALYLDHRDRVESARMRDALQLDAAARPTVCFGTEVFREDWDDPAMDVYDRLFEHDPETAERTHAR